MQSLGNLFNQALSVIGADPVVTDPNGPGKAQITLRLWYPVARQAVLTAHHWGSVRKIKLLARSGTRNEALDWADGFPAPDYLYAYAVPGDMVQPQYMENYAPFELGRIGSEKVIYSNDTRPILRYTMDDEVTVNWEPDLYRCIIWALGACINMQRSGKMAVTQKLEQQVTDLVAEARMNAANSDDTYVEAIPSFYAGTGFSVPSIQNRFYYPTSTFRLTGV